MMTTYNFDEIIDRKRTDSIKWSKKHLEENFNAEDSFPVDCGYGFQNSSTYH